MMRQFNFSVLAVFAVAVAPTTLELEGGASALRLNSWFGLGGRSGPSSQPKAKTASSIESTSTPLTDDQKQDFDKEFLQKIADHEKFKVMLSNFMKYMHLDADKPERNPFIITDDQVEVLQYAEYNKNDYDWKDLKVLERKSNCFNTVPRKCVRVRDPTEATIEDGSVSYPKKPETHSLWKIEISSDTPTEETSSGEASTSDLASNNSNKVRSYMIIHIPYFAKDYKDTDGKDLKRKYDIEYLRPFLRRDGYVNGYVSGLSTLMGRNKFKWGVTRSKSADWGRNLLGKHAAGKAALLFGSSVIAGGPVGFFTALGAFAMAKRTPEIGSLMNPPTDVPTASTMTEQTKKSYLKRFQDYTLYLNKLNEYSSFNLKLNSSDVNKNAFIVDTIDVKPRDQETEDEQCKLKYYIDHKKYEDSHYKTIGVLESDKRVDEIKTYDHLMHKSNCFEAGHCYRIHGPEGSRGTGRQTNDEYQDLFWMVKAEPNNKYSMKYMIIRVPDAETRPFIYHKSYTTYWSKSDNSGTIWNITKSGAKDSLRNLLGKRPMLKLGLGIPAAGAIAGAAAVPTGGWMFGGLFGLYAASRVEGSQQV